MLQLVNYPDCDKSSRNESNDSCQEESMVRYINYGGSKVDECVGQSWCHPQEKHIVQKPFSPFSHLKV